MLNIVLASYNTAAIILLSNKIQTLQRTIECGALLRCEEGEREEKINYNRKYGQDDCLNANVILLQKERMNIKNDQNSESHFV